MHKVSHVLSPTCIVIAPRGAPHSPFASVVTAPLKSPGSGPAGAGVVVAVSTALAGVVPPETVTGGTVLVVAAADASTVDDESVVEASAVAAVGSSRTTACVA